MAAGPRSIADPPRRTYALWLPACLLLLALGTAVHAWYLMHNCPLNLSGDEAHYWEWARRPALSYYSKGPLVAYLIAGGRALLGDWSIRVVGSEMLAVRFVALALSVFTGLGLFVLAARITQRGGLAFAAVAVIATIPIMSAGAMLMTIDAPLICAWVWALVTAEYALRRDALWAWIVLGLLIATGILAKYNMVLIFPAVGLVLLTVPQRRRLLRRPGPYLATVIGFAGLLPILIWNAQHGWVSFRHVAGQAGVSGGVTFDPLGAAAYIGGQAAVLTPIWFGLMLVALVALARRPPPVQNEHHDTASLQLLLYAAAIPWVVFLLFSPITKVQPNWPALSYPPAVILMVIWIARLWSHKRHRRAVRGFTIAGALCGVAAVLVAHNTQWLTPVFGWLARGSPPLHLTAAAPPWELTPVARYDPTARLRGHAQLGAAVGEVLADERAAGHDPFILADDYQVASLLAFYTPGEPTVYCAQPALGGRLSQYDLWENPLSDPGPFLGRRCIYVGNLDPVINGPHGALPDLQRVRVVEHKVRGYTYGLWTIFVAPHFAGFPQDEAATKY